MTRRALFLVSAILLSTASCNPFGSNSEITADEGEVLGLYPTFTPADGSSTPSNPVSITMDWSGGVTGFALSDLVVTGGSVSGLTGGSKTFVFSLTATAPGPVTIQVPAGIAFDEQNEPNIETSYTINYDITGPQVTVNKATSQSSGTATLPINFTVTFDEAVDASSFTTSDVTQNGTASGITWTVTDSGDHTTFTLAATAITGNGGTVKPSIAAGAVVDNAGNNSGVSTSTDNTVYYIPNYTDLKLWLRADSIGVANGANVTSWADQSPAANNVSEATNPPTFLTNAQNSLPAVKFNGSDVLISASSSGITGNPNLSVFLVSRLNGVSASSPPFLQIGETATDGNSAWVGLFNLSSNLFTGVINGGTRTTGNVTGTFGLYVWVRDSASGTAAAQTGNSQFWNGGAAAVTTAYANPAVSLTDGRLRIGRGTWGATIDADIAEILVFNNRAFGASDRAILEGYLRIKYNLY